MSGQAERDPLNPVRHQIDRIKKALPTAEYWHRRTISPWLDRVITAFKIGEGEDGIDELRSSNRNILIKSLVMYLGITATALEENGPPSNWDIGILLQNMRTYEELVGLAWSIHHKATSNGFSGVLMDQWKTSFETSFWRTGFLQPNTVDLGGLGDLEIVKDKLESLLSALKSAEWRDLLGYCSEVVQASGSFSHVSPLPQILPLMPTPRSHLRSTKGRRPPYTPYQVSKPIDSVSIEDLELGDMIELKPYEDGKIKGARKAWNDEHEALIEWLYQPDSPCLVNPLYPNEHIKLLSNIAFASRARGMPVVISSADELECSLGSETFSDQYMQPWLALNKKKQEKLLLAALASVSSVDSDRFARFRKLLPEVIISDLVADKGQGLVRFYDHLRTHLEDGGSKLSQHPVPNDKFFAKFGIPTEEGALPLAQGDRAFQEEYLLARHSILFDVAEATLRQIVGKPMPSIVGKAGNTASDITRRNYPQMRDGAPDPTKPLSDGFEHLVTERCSVCNKSAKDAGLAKLLYCQACKKVDRMQPYCSAACQKEDWSEHKKESCGSAVSNFHPVPVISARPPRSAPSSVLSTRRRSVKKWLNKYKDEFWVFEIDGRLEAMGYYNPQDQAKEKRIRKTMRDHAHKALETGDQASIDLFAYAMIGSIHSPILFHANRRNKRSGDGLGRDRDVTREEKKVVQFRQTFGLETEDAWRAALKRGKEELAKPENGVVRELYDQRRGKWYVDFISIGHELTMIRLLLSMSLKIQILVVVIKLLLFGIKVAVEMMKMLFL
ncbi:hypothetical protein JCM5353_004505 [Sporobolomyces roseus]